MYNPLTETVKVIGKGAKKLAETAVEEGKEAVETAVEGVKAVGGAVKSMFVDPDVREEGLSGAEIYRIFTEGNSQSLHTAAEAWQQSGDQYEQARLALTDALRAAWPDWEGAAAAAARTAMAPLEQNLADARDAAVKASTSIGTQAHWFDLTRNKVHKLADNPPMDPGPFMTAMFRDMEAKADAYHEKADANRQFYREYVDATRQNLGALPEFTPPRLAGVMSQGAMSSATAASGAVPSVAVPSAGSPAWQESAGLRPQDMPPSQPGGVSTGAVRPSGFADTAGRSGTGGTVAARSTGHGGESGRFGGGYGGGYGADAGGGSQFGRPGAESGRPGGRVGESGRSPARPVAQPPAGTPAPLGQAGKRDDDERSRRSRLPGPDRWQLFGLDEEPPPAVIGLWKEKS